MHSATFKTPSFPSPSSPSYFPRISCPNPRWIQFNPKNKSERELFFKSLKCIHSDSKFHSLSSHHPLKSQTRKPNQSASCLAVTVSSPAGLSGVADRLHSLISEFKSLSEPIDRVKRLLHYASTLPPFDESARVQSNRVMGCTAQVWLEANMDLNGAMRFRADSDSEITKGFCSCLIWVLDGAAPEEVLAVKTDDMVEMNVGLAGRAHSRVNTWHNVLISMQNRTKAMVGEREDKLSPEHFPPLVVTVDDIAAKGSYPETQARFVF
ncbi:sufE-like protein 2, chloroplastic [Cornus florida]|uniref:sufE-like protein 2, chloroplastic n=1 Tax=Cornus florida TaxID=4283 RepID=UPI00289B021F|nr:sufE-like protein 2, chloroplastic [Cornus florida]